jgi:ATP-dependent Clp protease ATP-binding subunit ClpA
MIELKDILINARQESHRMRHYYLGIEHLFIALLEIKSGLTSNILAESGLSSEYVIDAIRRKTGNATHGCCVRNCSRDCQRTKPQQHH